MAATINISGGLDNVRRTPSAASSTYGGSTVTALQPVQTLCKRVGYFRMEPIAPANSGRARPALRLNQVDGDLCSHLVLAQARLEPTGQIHLDEALLDHLNDVLDFKHRHPSVRLMISIVPELGSHQDLVGPAECQSPEAFRMRCARSMLDFLAKFHLDGLDLNLEQSAYLWPNFAGSIQLAKLLESLRSAIIANFYDRQLAEQHQKAALSNGSGRYSSCSNRSLSSVEPYILTLALGTHDNQLNRFHGELRHLANLTDWLHIFSFDYFQFRAFTPFTGPNAPLYPVVDPIVPVLGKLSLSSTLNKLLVEEQVPVDKLVLGVATYGRAYRLLFKQTQPSAAFSIAISSRGGRQDSKPAPSNQSIQSMEDQIENQQLGYREICDLIKQPTSQLAFDERSRTPFLLTDAGQSWITFENSTSVREKIRFIIQNKLAGYLTWSLNDDAYDRGWPLHKAMLDQVMQSITENSGTKNNI